MNRKSGLQQQRLLSAARKLFFHSPENKLLNVQEICHQAHLSKMTFHRYFKNKDALAIRLLDDMFNGSWW